MSQNYKKRVENFVINMLENPVQINEYRAPKAYKIRDEFPEKFIGDAQIYVKGFKHEKDRIKDAQKKWGDLDYFPNTIVANHTYRPREKQKEIQQDMKFTSKTSLERIQAFLKQHMQTQVENTDFRKEKKKKNGDIQMEENSIFNESEKIPNYIKKRAVVAREIAKNLLPSLHQKTHFQAAETMYNSQPLSIVDKSRYNLKSSPNLFSLDKNKHQNYPSIHKNKESLDILDEIDDDSNNNNKKLDQMEAFNPVETSMRILKDCKILKEKNPKIKTMKVGEGHMIATSDKSVLDVYQKLYPRDLYYNQQNQTSHLNKTNTINFNSQINNTNNNKKQNQNFHSVDSKKKHTRLQFSTTNYK
ncbi:hypothetical protein PPERSA_07017 [Pseudocohnilembus persalinus]|uniref:Uncharacterized protein n=1 Tax=Pseudocohnilembus persalinus TaxID=266149 RepID=A0A0V0QML3_PSEPJ|nr:hypothetical protein PPERSA_07017 [Pseudocohnilembus persalinus]|eukprot:KRX03189.1 hypothetical protein PPERSA_07017 [Pseudocohnilembus persalinus]